MSWIISRHLYKSGGNEIYNRIGNYNKHSSRRCIGLRQIYKSMATSVKKKEQCTDTVNATDEYINRRALYIDFAHSGASSNSYRTPYWDAERAYYKIWATKYANNIVEIIFKDSTIKSFLKKTTILKRSFISKNIKETFIITTLKIISSNKKYSSWQEMLKERNHQSLMTKILAKSLSKFEKERSGSLVYCRAGGGRRMTRPRASRRLSRYG